MLRRFIFGVSLLLTGVLSSCESTHEPVEVQKTGVRFELETSIDNDVARVVTYDANNSFVSASGTTVYRLLAGSTLSSHVLIFDSAITPTYGKSNLVGYTKLNWKFTTTSTGTIKATCYGEYKVYKAEMVASTTGISGVMDMNIDESQEITLAAGRRYTFVGLVTDNPLDKTATFWGTTALAPSVSFAPEDYSRTFTGSKLSSMQGEIPYYFMFSNVIPKAQDFISYKPTSVSMRLGTVVARVEVTNESTRPLTGEDIRLNFVGLTSRLRAGFMLSNMRPSFGMYAPYTQPEVLTPNEMLLPIESLGVGEHGVYFVPLALANGSQNNASLTHASITVDSPQTDITIVNSNTNAPFSYTVTGRVAAFTAWVNSGAKLKVIKLTVR